jgi:Viral BACON domain
MGRALLSSILKTAVETTKYRKHAPGSVCGSCRFAPPDFPGGLEAVHFGHLAVHHDDVGVRIDPLNQLGQSNTRNDVAVSAAKLSVLGTGGPSLVVLPATRAVSAETGSTAFSIYNAGGGTMTWTAGVSGASWLHLGAGSSAGTGSGAMVVTCDANPLTSPRTGTITVSAPGASPATAGRGGAYCAPGSSSNLRGKSRSTAAKLQAEARVRTACAAGRARSEARHSPSRSCRSQRVGSEMPFDMGGHLCEYR